MDLMALEDEPAPKAGQELVAHVLGRRGEATKVRPSTVEPLHRTYFRDGQVRGRASSQGNSGSQGRDEVVPHLKWVPQGFQKGLWGLGTQVETWFGAALSQVAVTTKFWGFCCENPKSFCMTAAVPSFNFNPGDNPASCTVAVAEVSFPLRVKDQSEMVAPRHKLLNRGGTWGCHPVPTLLAELCRCHRSPGSFRIGSGWQPHVGTLFYPHPTGV